jgi:hypothetical protein
MNIEVVSSGELIKKLQNVTLRKKYPTVSDIKPYEKALITIETFDPEALAPTQRYVLDTELKKVEKLRWDILEEYPHDIFRLNGYLKCIYEEDPDPMKFSNADGSPAGAMETKVIDILPPVIEEYIDFRGELKLIINDGQHRCYLAWTMGCPITVAYVRGVNRHYPYYAYPLPFGWEDVDIVTEIPEGYIKKFHVAKDHKSLYRNFNSQFENIGDSRPYTS